MRARCAARTERAARALGLVTALALLALGLVPVRLGAATPVESPPLAFALLDGRGEINRFLRAGPMAAHLVLRAGRAPRVLVVFPAGDSGVGLWLASSRAMSWRVERAPRAIEESDARGRVLRGIEVELAANLPTLGFIRCVLSSVRVLRGVASGAALPAALQVAAHITGNSVSWERDRLDGAAGYRLTIEALAGTRVGARGLAASSGGLHLRLRALSGEAPLTPLDALLLKPQATGDARDRSVLSFLSYREKYLAGSWRFDTYFGRDTLMTLLLLESVLRAEAIDSGIGSVLERLAPDGEVAHEEAIGEFAILLNQAAGRGLSAEPVYDYGMIDESFMLAPLAERALLASPSARAEASTLLARRTPSGETFGAALVRNFDCVVRGAAAFAAQPLPTNLIGLKPGHASGNWRDSEQGLDGGRYPYDVNVALVPAALTAIAQLLDSGLLDPYLTSSAEQDRLSTAVAEQRVWAQAAAPLFRVRIEAKEAGGQLARYARWIGVSAAAPLTAVRSPVVFAALALDAQGHVLPVMHSDEGFTLLLGSPSSDELERMLAVLRPFPAGLLTPIGLLVANPAYADALAQSRFTRHAYHGTVVWPWQQALWIAGLDHQLARADLTPGVIAKLRAARAALRGTLQSTRGYRGEELWSWRLRHGHYTIEAFAPPGDGELESDGAQLWSTAPLGLAGAVE